MNLKLNKYLGALGVGFIPIRLVQSGICEYPVCSIWERGYMFQLKYAVSLINIGLILAVFVLYANIYRKTKSPFSLGLTIFSFAFLINILTSSPILQVACGFRSSGLGPFLILPDLFITIALSILVYLTTK
ncbi:MAG: hypothetical protein APG12_00899 [Candidatus Methanofastidiosum methylothiophilum]|uniref:Uncharacterized protein n=1 Tax=Candidatus Methanofastidiosum methylothiophilum TaxID=1705564 RepID=A0A150IKU2_9EURY|nr:MAG: hypothetical protein APG10_00713 [Candidatus Methanofastidiosum methylthiophilus]KYC47713.1 MAG: hypothetical protein APG11_00959 [Candidatus Methanofastidiosum methylthiophilus]KYC50281.1 MAG: hypothetical protein APG12_00899 [Candidatus Methanofastidiosum methylthiophilus]